MAATLLLVKQGREVLHEFSQPHALKAVTFTLTLAWWAASTWYVPRERAERIARTEGRQLTGPARWVPRWLGVGAFAIVAAAFACASSDYTDAQLRSNLALAALLCLLAGIAFFFATRSTRWLPAPKLLAWGSIGVGTLVLVGLCAWPLGSGELFGCAGFLFASFAVLLATSLIADDVRHSLGVPAWPLLVLGFVVSSPFNDNHRVDPLPGSAPRPADFGAAFRDWLAPLQQRDGECVPVFVAFAEGGGIRAAYWTATVLGTLQQDNPAFARHLFAISGISGGSLGALLFAHEVRRRDGLLRGDCAGSNPFVCTTRRVLGRDFLAPVLGRLLFSEVVQRFLPFPFLPDRGGALERGWAAAYRDQVHADDFARPFMALWADRDFAVPNLFLNTTWAETGRPVVGSNLSLDSTVLDADHLSDFADGPLTGAQVAHLSARFPVISPPGALVNHGYVRHFVDGGYVESTGAATALGIVQMLKKQVREGSARADAFRIVVLALHNDPVDVNADPRPESAGWVTELSVPMLTLDHARAARGQMAERALRNELQVGAQGQPPQLRPRCSKSTTKGTCPVDALDPFVPFDIRRSAVPIPLGWMLSETAMDEMDVQIAKETALSKQVVHDLLAAPVSELCKLPAP